MSNEIQFILYQLPDDEGKVQVVIKDETIWATQKAMAPGSVTPRAGIMSFLISSVSSCICDLLFFMSSTSCADRLPFAFDHHLLASAA